jgi:hypothetical protein
MQKREKYTDNVYFVKNNLNFVKDVPMIYGNLIIIVGMVSEKKI